MGYLYQLNVTVIREKLKLGPPGFLKEYVEHYIETWDDRKIAD